MSLHLFRSYYLVESFLLLSHVCNPEIFILQWGKKNLTPNVTPNILESMFEYKLISSILDRICEMTKKLLEYPRDDTRLNPLRYLLEIKTWGTKWKRVINKTNEWATLQWANAKIDKESLSLLKQITHISKEDIEDYNLAMFAHAIDFFKKHVNLKNPIPKHFFTSLLSNLSTKNLVTLNNLLSTKFMKPKRWLYATLGKQVGVPQELRNKILNHPVNHRMIGPTLKPQETYDNQKWHVKKWWRD
jgi:hypothetical protein